MLHALYNGSDSNEIVWDHRNARHIWRMFQHRYLLLPQVSLLFSIVLDFSKSYAEKSEQIPLFPICSHCWDFSVPFWQRLSSWSVHSFFIHIQLFPLLNNQVTIIIHHFSYFLHIWVSSWSWNGQIFCLLCFPLQSWIT
jgi:hypothetical protein